MKNLRRVLSVFLALLLAFAVFPQSALVMDTHAYYDDYSDGMYTYVIPDGGGFCAVASIDDYSVSDYIIPESYMGEPITTIGCPIVGLDTFFYPGIDYDYSKHISLTIPDTIESVVTAAFDGREIHYDYFDTVRFYSTAQKEKFAQHFPSAEIVCLCKDEYHTLVEEADGLRCLNCDYGNEEDSQEPQDTHLYTDYNDFTCNDCDFTRQPEYPSLVSADENSIVLYEKNGFEYSIDGENWQDSGTFSALDANTTYYAYQRVKATDANKVSEPSLALPVMTVDQTEIFDVTIYEYNGRNNVVIYGIKGEYSYDTIAIPSTINSAQVSSIYSLSMPDNIKNLIISEGIYNISADVGIFVNKVERIYFPSTLNTLWNFEGGELLTEIHVADIEKWNAVSLESDENGIPPTYFLENIDKFYVNGLLESDLTPPEITPSADVLFEIGEVIYNAEYNEIEVPLYVAENNSDIYAAEIALLSNEGLLCSAILEGDIKDEIDKGGRVGIVEFGFNYTMNPANNLALVDSQEATKGISTTGLAATFCYTAPTGFDDTDLVDYTFSLGERTLIVAFDMSRPTFALKERELPFVCEHSKISELIVKAATCTEQGSKNIICNDCGEVLSTEEISPLGHSETIGVITLSPTCTEEGIESIICIACGEVLRTQEIPPFGHGETREEITLYPTCTEDGIVSLICIECGEVVSSFGFGSSGHDFEPDPENYVAPSCTETGKTAYKCACGATMTEVTPALGHGAEEEVVIKEAEIGVAGLKEIRCSVCGEVLRTEEIPALSYVKGDTNGDGSVDADDLRLTKLLLAKLISADDPEVVFPDVDGNEKVNAKDLAILYKIMVGLYTE